MIKHDKTVSHRINRNKNHERFVSNKADVPGNEDHGISAHPLGKRDLLHLVIELG